MKEYRKLAKEADQRMVRLESYKYKKGFENILNYAYAKAQRNIRPFVSAKRLEKGTPLRFNTAPPKTKAGDIDVRKLQQKINVIKDFLSSDTSVLQRPRHPFANERGAKAVFQDKADAINRDYGTNFTWETLAKYFEDGTADKLSAKYGSKTALRIIGQIQKNSKEVLKSLEQVDKKRIKTDNPFLQKKVNEVLKEYGADIKDLL